MIAILRAIAWLFGIRIGRVTAESQSGKKVAVLIPAHNEADILPLTLSALLNQTFPAWPIVVIDDGSTDQTAQVAKKLGCQVIRFDFTSGSKAKAINRALAQLKIKADYIVLIDADTLLAKDALERALGYFQKEGVEAVCGYVLSAQTQTIWQKIRAVEYIVGGAFDKGTQEWWGVPLIMAGCFTVWRADLLFQSGFPERTFTEDLDLSWQLIAEGYRLVYASEAKCWTIDPQKWSAFRLQLLRWRRGFIQNVVFHFKNWIKKPRMAFFILWWLLGSGMGALAYLTLLFWLILKQKWLWFLVLTGSELGYLTLTTLIQGRRLGYPLRVGVWAVYYWLLKPVSLYLFWEALVRELWSKSPLVWGKTREKGVIQMYQPGIPIGIGGLVLRLPILAILTVALLAVPSQVARDLGASWDGKLPEVSITFTFDDGWKSVYEQAFPIFKECGAVGTVFVVTSRVGFPGFMSWNELTVLAQSNWEIASHSVNHRDLIQLQDEELVNELSQSKIELERHGFKIFSFASPFGSYNEKILEAIMRFYQAHRTLDPGINYRPIDPQRLKAFDVNRDGLEDLNQAFHIILETKRTKGHLVLVFHKIDEEGELSYPGWKLQALCQYARAQGFELFTLRKGG